MPTLNKTISGITEKSYSMSRSLVSTIGCTLITLFVLSSGVGHVTAQETATPQASASKAPAQGSDVKAAAGQATPVVPTTTVEEEPDPATLAAKASYILGFNTAKKMVTDLARQGIDVNQERMLVGIQDAMAGSQSKYSPEEVKVILGAYQKMLQKQQMVKMEKESTENRTAGDAYRKENGAKDGVTQLEGGIQYEVLTKGDGVALDQSGRVMVDYSGKFIDGTVFDSSLTPKRGRPASPVPMSVSGAGMIPAFAKILPKMTIGSKWRVCIPPELAYGVRGQGPIGPNETLVFEIDIKEKVPAPVAKPKMPATPKK